MRQQYWKGNSIQHWCMKATAYKGCIGRMWELLHKYGVDPDGKTDVVDEMERLIKRLSAPSPKGEEEA